MAPVWVVILTVLAVAGPLIGGWIWSSSWQNRRLGDVRLRLLTAERELRSQRRHLVDIGARARGVVRMIAPKDEEIPADPALAIVSMHAHLRKHSEEMTLLHSRQRRLHSDLANTQRKLIALKPAAEARLSDNLEFQAHLAEVTAERDQLKHRVSELAKDPRQRANRVALRNARQEIEELRFQLRMANRAILDLEVQLTEAKVLASIDSTAPLPQYPDI